MKGQRAMWRLRKLKWFMRNYRLFARDTCIASCSLVRARHSQAVDTDVKIKVTFSFE